MRIFGKKAKLVLAVIVFLYVAAAVEDAGINGMERAGKGGALRSTKKATGLC